MRNLIVGVALVAAGAVAMALVTRLLEGSRQSLGSATPGISEPWKVQGVAYGDCSLMNGHVLNVRVVLKGQDTVVSCPSSGECQVGRVTPTMYFLSVRCERRDRSAPDWKCTSALLDLVHIARRDLLPSTVSVVQVEVKQIDVDAGEIRIGPVYGGVDLVLSGMGALGADERRKGYLHGGTVTILGVGESLAHTHWPLKSKIELNGQCQVAP